MSERWRDRYDNWKLASPDEACEWCEGSGCAACTFLAENPNYGPGNPDWSSVTGHLTREILDEFFVQIKKRDESAAREHAERVRQVSARGPYKSALGQIIDAVYIKHGPLIVSPKVARHLQERLERDEHEAAERSAEGASTAFDESEDA